MVAKCTHPRSQFWWDNLTQLWLAYLQKSTIDIYNHTLPLIPQVAPMRLTLHGQCCIHYENIFTSCRRCPQDIPRSPWSRCAVVASHTTNTQPVPHDRDCPQAILVLRGQVRDSHHPVWGNLSSYLAVGASLENSKLHKVNLLSKTQLLATC
jgi:hypothetical protein